MANQAMIQREKEASDLVAKKIKQIKLITGDDKKASTFGSALVHLSQIKTLEKCTVESILNVGFQIVQAGLNPNPLFGQAYVVPFNVYKKDNNGKPTREIAYTLAQLQIGYKGYIQLGFRAGWRFEPVAVYKCDDFHQKLGDFGMEYSLIPDIEKRDESNSDWVYENLKGVIVFSRDKNGFISRSFVPFAQLEKLRLSSPNQKTGVLDYIWKQWTIEMYFSKAYKNIITRLPIGDEFTEVMNKENEPYIDVEITKSSKQIEKQKDMNKL